MSDIVTPLAYRCLIKVERLENKVDGEYEKLSEKGFTMSTNDEHSRRQAGQIWGTLVAMGPTAFMGPDWQSEHGASRDLIKVGDKVLFARYSSSSSSFNEAGKIEGGATAQSRVCADTDILAVVNKDIEETS